MLGPLVFRQFPEQIGARPGARLPWAWLGRVATVPALADEAEDGYDVDHLVARRNKRGRPTLGAGPASVESVRLDPELKDQLLLRAEQDHTSPSDVIREALRRYLQPS